MKINIFKKKIFRDTRGIIADVIYKNQINHIGYISSKKNSIRGNHYHKKTTQYNFVLDGVINYYSKTKKQKKIKIIKLKKGDLILTKPNEIHAFKTISRKSVFMVLQLVLEVEKIMKKILIELSQ